jgi:hypothetical protein
MSELKTAQDLHGTGFKENQGLVKDCWVNPTSDIFDPIWLAHTVLDTC